MDIKFEETDGKLSVVTPYNPTFAKRAKRLGGRWQKSAWVFDLREREAVSQLCLSIWGTDTTDGPPTSVTLERDTAEPESIAERLIQRQNGSPATIYLAGIEVAWCEDEPKHGRNCVFEEGYAERRKGVLLIPGGSRFTVRDIPPGTARKICEEVESLTLGHAAIEGRADGDESSDQRNDDR